MKRVFLVGYMGVGKTTIGKRLSAEIGVEFIDLDKYIEKRYRKSIKDVFDEKGEDGFRKNGSVDIRQIAMPKVIVSFAIRYVFTKYPAENSPIK